MANYQVLFNGDIAEAASIEAVRDNLARELGLDERKAKQLFSGRTVVIRSQLDHDQAKAWAEKLASLGAICRITSMLRTIFSSRPMIPSNVAPHIGVSPRTSRTTTRAASRNPRPWAWVSSSRARA